MNNIEKLFVPYQEALEKAELECLKQLIKEATELN